MRIKLLGLAVLMAVAIAGCDTASQDVEPVVSPDGYPTATFAPTTKTCNEGDTIYFKVTTDKPIDRAITFTFKQKGGTANSEDYTAFPAVLQPYTKSVDLMIITWQDFDFTATETIQGEIGVYSIADRYLLNPLTVNPTPVTVTLNNYVGQLTVDFYWGKDITILVVGTFSTTNNVDFDIWYADAEGFDPADVWLTYIDYIAATGNHPESVSFEGIPNGTYYLIANLWSNAFAGSGVNTTIPITCVFNRQGTAIIEYEITQADADALNSEQPGYDDDESDVNFILCKVKVENGKYTIYDTNDVSFGPYKKGTTGKTPRVVLNK